MISIRLSLVGDAGGLQDEHVAAANVLEELHHHLAIGELADDATPEADVEMPADGLGETRIRVAGENAHALEGHDRSFRPVGPRRQRRTTAPSRNGWGGRIRTFECRNQNRTRRAPQSKPETPIIAYSVGYLFPPYSVLPFSWGRVPRLCCCQINRGVEFIFASKICSRDVMRIAPVLAVSRRSLRTDARSFV